MSSYLIVDDSATIRSTLAATIRAIQPSATVTEAADEKQALAAIAKARPDVVFLDMMLTDEGGGLEVGVAIVEKWPTVRIILLTGLPESAPEVRKAISMGAFAYLQKPIRRQAVQAALDSIDQEGDRLRRIR